MSQASNIEWTDATWNPIRGCSRVSPGCQNCYAERQAIRQSGPGKAYEGLVHIANGHPAWTGVVEFAANHLEDPLHWREPKRIFVNSMSDLFHEAVTDDWIDKIFAVMALCPEHTFQVLTKRPERMLKYLTSAPWGQIEIAATQIACEYYKSPCAAHLASDATDIDRIPLPNVWLGVSVENQKYADERIPLLLMTPAAMRFISAEPLLGPLQIPEYLPNKLWNRLDSWKQPELDWVIVGGESGPGSRPFHTEWAASIVDQCRTARVPVFVKQLGAHVIQDGERRKKRDRKGGDMSEWPHEIRVREYPNHQGREVHL